jgi:thiol:disulfide interchange protein
MTIDAIGQVTGVSALGASRTELAAGNGGASTNQPPPAEVSSAEQDAALVAVSAEALAQQQADEDQAAREAAAAASASAVTTAVSSDWAAGAPPVENAAIKEALQALDEASRQNDLQVQAAAVTAQQDQATHEQHAISEAATASVQRQDDIILAALNAGVQLAFGALATPITGDPALRQPGRVEVVA